MKAKSLVVSALLASLLGLGLSGCQQRPEPKPDFSAFRDIANLATLECYYHNVADHTNPGTDIAFGIVNVGYKRVWFEYDGMVTLGIDASKVYISEPDANDVVTVYLPEARVVGYPDVDYDSFSEMHIDSGLLTTVNVQDTTEAYECAQQQMKEAAEKDAELVRQANERAQLLFEQYVKNAGEAIGKQYTVVFKDSSDLAPENTSSQQGSDVSVEESTSSSSSEESA